MKQRRNDKNTMELELDRVLDKSLPTVEVNFCALEGIGFCQLGTETEIVEDDFKIWPIHP